jgi:hypothetical protein
VNQLHYISGIFRDINSQTELLEMLDWEEKSVAELLKLVSQTINETDTSSLILTVSNKLTKEGYSDDVVRFISEYITNITLYETEKTNDC